MITVYNVKKGSPPPGYILYIGRANKTHNFAASPLANPHNIGTCRHCGEKHDRGSTLPLYREWLREQWAQGPANPARKELEWLISQVQAGKDVGLGCWCKPEPCHGDVIKEVIEQIIESRKRKS